MPSGYTAGVGNGSVVEFGDYAWRCARAFDALVTMRDAQKFPIGSSHPTFTLLS